MKSYRQKRLDRKPVRGEMMGNSSGQMIQPRDKSGRWIKIDRYAKYLNYIWLCIFVLLGILSILIFI